MWIEDPRLQYKVIWGSNSANTDANNKRSSLPVRDQLAEAASLADGLEILKGNILFPQKLTRRIH